MMITRSSSRVPPVRAAPDCAVCDHNYRTTFREITAGIEGLGVYDIDLVLEFKNQIFALVEWKRIRGDFPEYFVPVIEYMAGKKFGKMLHVPPFVVYEVVDSDRFVVFPVNRFERDREFRTVPGWSGQVAVFRRGEGMIMDRVGFRGWLRSLLPTVQGGRV